MIAVWIPDRSDESFTSGEYVVKVKYELSQ